MLSFETHPKVPFKVVVWSIGSHVSSRLTDKNSDSRVTVTRYHAPRTRVSNNPHRDVPVAPIIIVIIIFIIDYFIFDWYANIYDLLAITAHIVNFKLNCFINQQIK